MSLEGEIASVAWVNPHILITLKTDDAKTYTVAWFSLGQLTSVGLTTESFQAGDRVVVTGSEHRDPEMLVVTLLTRIRRASGEWIWSKRVPTSDQNPCSA